MDFPSAPIRKHNDSDQLIAAGFEWTEGKWSFRQKLFANAGLTIIASIAVLFGMSFRDGSGLWISGIGAVFLLLSFIGIYRSRPRDWFVVFTTENISEAPDNKIYPKFPPKRITSIQYQRNEFRGVDEENTPKHPSCKVIFLNDDGDIATVAGDLHEDEAVKVTAQLTKALNEIRAAMAIKSSVKDGVLHMEIDADAFDDIDPLAPHP